MRCRGQAAAFCERADAIVAYHPPIFTARKRITDEDAGGRILLAAIAAGIGPIIAVCSTATARARELPRPRVSSPDLAARRWRSSSSACKL